MIEVLHDSARGGLQRLEIYEHTDVVELLAAHVNLNFPVMAMEVFTFAAVSPQSMRRREFFFDHHLVHRFHLSYRCLQRCLLYTSDAADERSSVDLGGRRII